MLTAITTDKKFSGLLQGKISIFTTLFHLNFQNVLVGRAAGNRTQSASTPWTRTAGILQPENILRLILLQTGLFEHRFVFLADFQILELQPRIHH